VETGTWPFRFIGDRSSFSVTTSSLVRSALGDQHTVAHVVGTITRLAHWHLDSQLYRRKSLNLLVLNALIPNITIGITHNPTQTLVCARNTLETIAENLEVGNPVSLLLLAPQLLPLPSSASLYTCNLPTSLHLQSLKKHELFEIFARLGRRPPRTYPVWTVEAPGPLRGSTPKS
jgi:hypothetical protein